MMCPLEQMMVNVISEISLQKFKYELSI